MENIITIRRKSPFSGEINSMEIPLSEEDWIKRWMRYESGAHIQDAFDVLNPDQREFIMTGITPAEWNETFPE